MTKKVLIISALVFLSSCGAITSNGVTPAVFNSWQDRDPITRVDNSVKVSKSGSSCVTNILSLYSYGDSSIESAKKNGNINRVGYVDRTYKSFLGLYQEGCTVVKGN